MTLPPIVERELRGVARGRAFAWGRGALALFGGLKVYDLLNRFELVSVTRAPWLTLAPAAPVVTGAMMLQSLAGLLFFAALLMSLLGADSIARERREGTLGLLFLTRLAPAQIVYQKMLACGLRALLLMLGAVPALMVPVLVGGVSGRQAVISALGLLNALFVALAAGIWMSARFQERRYAIPATLALVTALAFGAEALGSSALGLGAGPVFRLLGLAGWMSLAQMSLRWPILIGFCGFWFLFSHAWGWFFLWRATAALRSKWQDEPQKHFRESKPPDDWATGASAKAAAASAESTSGMGSSLLRVSWLTDPRPWDADPIQWRAERLGSVQGVIWLAVAFNFLAQFGVAGSGGALARSWGLLSFAGLLVMALCSAVLAWTGARFFQNTRQQHDFELLVTTPVGNRQLLAGQWRPLLRALVVPLTVVALIALPAAVLLMVDWIRDYRNETLFLLPPVLIALNVVVEAVAVCRVGMWAGLRSRNMLTSVALTLGLVEIIPLAIAVALISCWVDLGPNSGALNPARRAASAAAFTLFFFMIKNVALIVWSGWSMRRELRLARRSSGQGFLRYGGTLMTVLRARTH